MKSTVGQLLINNALPADMRDYTRVLDPKGTQALYRELAEKHPDDYAEVALNLSNVAREAAYLSGGASFSLKDFRPSPPVRESRVRLTMKINRILDDTTLDKETKNEQVVQATSAERTRLLGEVMQYAKDTGNPLGKQVTSGARGDPSSLLRLIGGDMLYTDHREKYIPLAVQRSYSEGLMPADYWAATFGARKGLMDTKLATADSGYLSKQMNQVAHRLMTTALDDDREQTTIRGMPVETSDSDNVGALLAASTGGYPRNTVITPKILSELNAKHIKEILVRSPTVGGPDGGGVYSRDVGMREKGTLPPLGDMVGLAATQAVGERLTQIMLKKKHAGATQGKAGPGGFELMNQMLQVPKHYPGGAAHSQVDGIVGKIEEAPAGGSFIHVGAEKHYVEPDTAILVKPGMTVEAGDLLSDGIPNPSEIVKHKGLGEGRRYFTNIFTQVGRDGGMPIHRRNIELLARGLINYVEMTDEDDAHVPGDVLPYSQLERNWEPREDAELLAPDRAVGRYLEQPVLHYTVGTPIRPSVVARAKQFGIKQFLAHKDPPPFQPVMIRAETAIQNDPDWLTKLYGSGQKKTLLSAASRGGTSDLSGTSFVPALVAGTTFGTQWPGITLRPPKS